MLISENSFNQTLASCNLSKRINYTVPPNLEHTKPIHSLNNTETYLNVYKSCHDYANKYTSSSAIQFDWIKKLTVLKIRTVLSGGEMHLNII